MLMKLRISRYEEKRRTLMTSTREKGPLSGLQPLRGPKTDLIDRRLPSLTVLATFPDGWLYRGSRPGRAQAPEPGTLQ